MITRVMLFRLACGWGKFLSFSKEKISKCVGKSRGVAKVEGEGEKVKNEAAEHGGDSRQKIYNIPITLEDWHEIQRGGKCLIKC